MAFQEVLTSFSFEFNKGKLTAIQKGVGRAVTNVTQLANQSNVVSQQIGGLFTRVKQLVGAYIGLRAVKTFTTDIVTQVGEIERGAKFLGLSVTRAQELRHAGLRNKLQYEDLTDVMKELAVKANDAFGIAKSKDANELFKQMGIVKSQVVDTNGALKSTDELLLVVADAYSKMGNKAKQAAAIDDLLSDSGRKAAKFLALGRKGIEQFAKEAHDRGLILDERTIAAAKRYKKVKAEVIMTMTAFRNELASAVLPAIVRVVEGLNRWWKRTRDSDRAMRALKITALLAGAVIGAMVSRKVIDRLGLFIKGLVASVRVLRAMNIQAALAQIKLFAVLAGFALIGLAIEDLVGFAQGKDSITGRLLGDSGEARALKDAIVSIGKAAVVAWRDIKPELLAAWTELKPAIGELWQAAKPLIGPTFKAGVFILVTGFKQLAIAIKISADWIKLLSAGARHTLGSFKIALGPVLKLFGFVIKQLERVLELMGLVSGKELLDPGRLRDIQAQAKQGVIRELDKPRVTVGPRGERIVTRFTKPVEELLEERQPAFLPPVRGVTLPPAGAPGAVGTIGRLPSVTNNANVAAGAVQVTVVTQADDPREVAREVNNLVTERVSAVITDASRNISKPPAGQR